MMLLIRGDLSSIILDFSFILLCIHIALMYLKIYITYIQRHKGMTVRPVVDSIPTQGINYYLLILLLHSGTTAKAQRRVAPINMQCLEKFDGKWGVLTLGSLCPPRYIGRTALS